MASPFFGSPERIAARSTLTTSPLGVVKAVHPFCDAFEIVLCDNCYAPLAFADARAWKWFRKYRDRRWPDVKQTTIKFKAGFIDPMLCAAVKELPEGSSWEYELKLDGYRARRWAEESLDRRRGPARSAPRPGAVGMHARRRCADDQAHHRRGVQKTPVRTPFRSWN
jgi:hypothetical protein